MDVTINKFIKQNSKILPVDYLNKSMYSINDDKVDWDTPEAKFKTDNPGYRFYTHPAKTILRDTKQEFSNTKTHPLNTKYFSFKEPTENPITLDKAIELSPPLEPIYKKGPPKLEGDPRVDVGTIYGKNVIYRTLRFEDITLSHEIIEPVIINFFLYDIDAKKRISETWRILPQKLQNITLVKALMSKLVLNAPTTVSFPIADLKDTMTHSRIALIVALDRELLKDGSANAQKYLMKPTPSNKKAAEDDIQRCNQFETTLTFAWTAASLADVFGNGDEHPYVFDKFVHTETASSIFLAHQFIEGMPKFKDAKFIPYAVRVVANPKGDEGVKLRHFYNFQHSIPYNVFQNTLYVNINYAKFKFPRGIRARNIVIHVQMMCNDKALKVFNGEDKYVTRTIYHEEKPTYFDEIKIDLPLIIPYEAFLQFYIFHASVKSNASSSLKKVGVATFKLFENNSFVKNGSHFAQVKYDKEEVESVGSNKIFFGINLFSSIYSSDSQVSAILNGQMKIAAPNPKELMPHLFSLLDTLLDAIQNENEYAFSTLLEVLSSFTKGRDDPSSAALNYYVKYCAFRYKHDKFYEHFTDQWYDYVKDNGDEEIATTDIQVSWFLFDLIIKSMVMTGGEANLDKIVKIVRKFSKKIPYYRNQQTFIGTALNHSLALLFKDLIDISNRETCFRMIVFYLSNLHLTQHFFDRSCFRDFIKIVFTPKVFLFSLLPLDPPKKNMKGKLVESPSFFEKYITPKIGEALAVEQHTNEVFKFLFDTLAQFTVEQHKLIFLKLRTLLNVLAKNVNVLKTYKNKANYIYIFVFVHYMFSYITSGSKLAVNGKQMELLSFQLRYGQTLTDEELQKISNEQLKSDTSIEVLNRRSFATYSEKRPVAQKKGGTRKFAMIKQQLTGDNTDLKNIFDTIAFCTQAIAIRIIVSFESVVVFNNVISTFFDIKISPYLNDIFIKKTKNFVSQQINECLGKPETNMKHVISRIIKNPTEQKIDLLNTITNAEKKAFGNNKRTTILVTHALSKHPPNEEGLKLLESTIFNKFAKQLTEINKDLTPEFKLANPDIYSFILLKKANLLSVSPDAMVDVLLELYEHQNACGFKSEAVMSQLCAAALVSEYLAFFGKIPEDFFQSKHPAENFTVACPAAEMVIIPSKTEKILLNGYCTSRYFTEYGMIYLIQASMETCKTGNLFELSTRIHSLLNPILQHRHLWRVLQKHYITGLLSWKISAQMYTASDRNLGQYYKVEFPDAGVYIYRETDCLNLWQVCAKLKKSCAYYSKGKEVDVVTEGQELDQKKFNDPSKYYLHVKFLNQYFTPDERQKRITVFEQNHNINQFYFDVPFSKSAQSGLEHCSLKRTIFTLEHPLPYLVNRVFVPEKNIQKIIFSPIEYAIQNLQSQVSKINEACVRVRAELAAAQKALAAGKPQQDIPSFKELQPLIQGSLLVQVNEGPEKMAEVFLTGDENNYQTELRNTFREFIKANTEAVKLHGELVMMFPIYSVLQEELELGLSKLTSKLQQYLK